MQCNTHSSSSSDDPEQFRAIGWCRGRLCSVIFEIRHDSEGEYYHLVTAWKALLRQALNEGRSSRPEPKKKAG
jgi:hypothetical protein